jgi:hypothetical protein
MQLDVFTCQSARAVALRTSTLHFIGEAGLYLHRYHSLGRIEGGVYVQQHLIHDHGSCITIITFLLNGLITWFLFGTTST